VVNASTKPIGVIPGRCAQHRTRNLGVVTAVQDNVEIPDSLRDPE